MAITKEGLKSKILADIDSTFADKDEAPVESYFYLKSIKDYVEQNAQVIVNYVGITDAKPPAPDVNPAGQAKIKCPNLEAGAAVKQFVHNRSEADPSGFVAAIMADAVGVVELQQTLTGSSPSIYQVIPVSGGISNTNNYRDAWDFICDAIVKSVLTLTFSPIPTKSQTPGSGISTLVKVV